MQTHLLKLEPPYRFIFDQRNGRVGKVIAVLLRVTDDPEHDRTISVPIVDMAYTWDDADLAECDELCDEFSPRISFNMYIRCLMLTDSRAWFPNGRFSVYSFGMQLNELGIRVVFPGEGDKEGEVEMTMKTKLHLGNADGVYWVENAFGSFFFNGSYKSRDALRSYLLERRNDYYRSFPQKRFNIVLYTEDKAFQSILDDINNTPYERE